MSIFDGDHNLPNIPLPTMGGEVFWEELDRRGGYVLQKNIFSGYCRILDRDNIRMAWGGEGPMRAKLRELAGENRTGRPDRGDVIGVHRIGGVYDHYGVYESDDCVYEYAGGDGDFGGGEIHITTLKKFIGNSGNYFVLEFPEKHGAPGKLPMPVGGLSSGFVRDPKWDVLGRIVEQMKEEEYHLYSPDETIRRARSRLGERAYNLALNNCEHFAIWCKTGLHESHQVDAVLRAMIRRPGIVR